MRKVILGYNDLATVNPVLAAEWHPTKNGDLTSNQVTTGSGKKVWWLGKCGHEWQAVIENRSKGNGCPICANQKVLAGYNDLATVNPSLAAEWHPTKNGLLTPEQVNPKSGKKVWWKCATCGCEWQTRIAGRAKGSGCPVCSQKRVGKINADPPKEKSLAYTNPSLTAEWHPIKNGDLTPKDVFPHSSQKVWWRCSKGHEWQAIIANRTKGRKCPICNAELQTSFPEQAIYYYLKKVVNAENRMVLFGYEIDIYLPEFQIGIEYNGRYYHRNKLKSDEEKVEFFSKNNIRIISVFEGDKNKISGDVIEYKYSSSDRTALEWAIKVVFRLINIPSPEINIDLDSVKIYEQYVTAEKEGSLFALFPEIAAEWHPTKNGLLTPEQVNPRSGKKVWWKCATCGHEWQTRIADRSEGKGCYVCGRKKLVTNRTENQLKKRGSLAEKTPEIAAEWHPVKNGVLSPYDVTVGSGKKVWWRCDKGHEWQAIVKSRTRGNGCPYCFHKLPIVGETDLATTNPALVVEWHPEKNGGLMPQNVVSGSNKKVWWKCVTCGHEWQAVISNRSKGHGCSICAKKKIWETRRKKTSVND